jgi:voltage-gated potassium channel
MRILSLYRSLFRAMWRALAAEQVKPLFTLVLLIALFGAIVFRSLEDWSFLDSFYFLFVTMATVGYGDFAPATGLGKIAAIVFMICGIGVFVLAISTFAQAILQAEKDWKLPSDGSAPDKRDPALTDQTMAANREGRGVTTD